MTFTKTCIKGTWYVLQDGQILSNGLPSEAAADRFILFMDELPSEPVRHVVKGGDYELEN